MIHSIIISHGYIPYNFKHYFRDYQMLWKVLSVQKTTKAFKGYQNNSKIQKYKLWMFSNDYRIHRTYCGCTTLIWMRRSKREEKLVSFISERFEISPPPSHRGDNILYDQLSNQIEKFGNFCSTDATYGCSNQTSRIPQK